MSSPSGRLAPTKMENPLEREYEALVKMNKMFEKINDGMDQARINLQ
ncbi:8524_t:CDS:1, partial [Funneliformis geosporum]